MYYQYHNAMRKVTLMCMSLVATFIMSCSTTSYYQVYKVVPSEKIAIIDNRLRYEDDNCTIYYNLWSEGGNIGFQFYNKTNNNIYVKKDECFFVLNGIAHDYYKEREYTSTESSGSTVVKEASEYQAARAIGVSSGKSVSRREVKSVCVPAKTSKEILEYRVNESFISNCDVLKYPGRSQIKTKSFTRENSPIVFGNKIAYIIGQSDAVLRIDHEFYVSEITNYPEHVIVEKRFEERCGEVGQNEIEYVKNVSPDKFFLRYTREWGGWDH